MKPVVALAVVGLGLCGGTAFEARAQSVELTLTGRIPPAVCSITLANGGVVDLGTMRLQSLNLTEETLVGDAEVPMSVTCDAPMRFAFMGTDNTSNSAPIPARYGLGLTPAGEKIGGAVVSFEDASADGHPAYYTRSDDHGSRWDAAHNGGPRLLEKSAISAFSTTAGTYDGPDPIQSLQVKLRVKTYIAPVDTLTIEGEVLIKGSATIEMSYF